MSPSAVQEQLWVLHVSYLPLLDVFWPYACMPVLSFPKLEAMTHLILFLLTRMLPHIAAWLHCLSISPPAQCAKCVIAAAMTPCVSSPCPLEQKAETLCFVFPPWQQRLIWFLFYSVWSTEPLRYCVLHGGTQHILKIKFWHLQNVYPHLQTLQRASPPPTPTEPGTSQSSAWSFSFWLPDAFALSNAFNHFFSFWCRRWDSLASISYYLNLTQSSRPTYSLFLLWSNPGYSSVPSPLSCCVCCGYLLAYLGQ